jgi:hypothetical protein
MTDKANPTIAERWADQRAIEAALRRATREADLSHARAGFPVATWRDGKVVWVQPDEVFRLLGTDGSTIPS